MQLFLGSLNNRYIIMRNYFSTSRRGLTIGNIFGFGPPPPTPSLPQNATAISSAGDGASAIFPYKVGVGDTSISFG